MEGILITSVLSSIGLGVSSFFGFFLLKNKNIENRLLAWLLIALSLRITKSIFYTHLELPLIVKNLGLAANLAVGPLLFLYVRALVGYKDLASKHLVHFVPSILYLFLSPILPNGGVSQFWTVSYSMILVQSFVYVGLSTFKLIVASNDVGNKQVRWAASLITGLFFMWLIYALIFLNIVPIYSLGAVSFSVLIFILSFVALKHYPLFKSSGSKYQNTRISDNEGQEYFYNLKRLVAQKELFKNPNLSLSILANEMDLLERDVSQLINQYGNCNYSQFINEFRIVEAKKMLWQQTESKIIAIALASGFNNLGTFNSAFKAHTGLTPSEYRKAKV